MRTRCALVALSAVLFAVTAAGCQVPTPTTVQLSVSATQLTAGQSVTLTAVVAQYPTGSATPTGQVLFLDGSTSLGSAALTGGRTSLTVTPAVGSHSITASFSGTNGWGSSTSTTTKVVITGTRYYIALGDSLAAGVGTSAGQGYVDDIDAHEAARLPGLSLNNLACSGATTTSMLNGGGCSYPQGTQVAAAVAFLQAHPGQVAFLTIDIGANDVTGCISASGVDATCAASRVATVQTNLATILSTLHNAAATLPIFGMTYYDPFLSYWVSGNMSAAAASQQALVTFNQALQTTYQQADARVAAVDVGFDSANFALTGSYQGTTVPQNVANVCAWTLMCSANNIHANATGHQIIAGQFEPLIDAAVGAS